MQTLSMTTAPVGTAVPVTAPELTPPVASSPSGVGFPPSPEALRTLVEHALDDDQAEHIVVIDLIGRAAFADTLVVASGRSTRHVGAMAEKLSQRLKAAGMSGIEIEGMPQCDWVLVDAGDIVVHLFRPEVRAFYNLEKMWGVEPPVSPAAATGGGWMTPLTA